MFKSCLFFLVLFFASSPLLADDVQVQWFGHSTTLIKSPSGKIILIDPFLTKNPVTPPLYRDPKSVGPIDLILVTHGHGDHVGDLLELVESTDARVVGNFELIINMINVGLLEGDRAIAMNKGGAIQPLGREFKIHMVPAEHSSSLDLQVLGLKQEHPIGQRFVAGGDPVGYVIEFESGFTIYHSGDTSLFGDMRLIGERFEPDLALVSIGGHFTMGPEDAAYAVREFLLPKRVLPIHYGTFPLINRTPEEFKEALGSSDIEVLDMAPGEILRF